MRLGLSQGYWAGGPPANALEIVEEADKLGYDSFWTAEAYGSDCFTPLAWYGSRTKNIRLATGITQMSARTPTATAMAAMTIDHLSEGRMTLGLGSSGPQVVEGWYGQEYGKPLKRTREYIDIIRKVVAREAPLRHEGTYFHMPIEGGTGYGKPLKSSIHPYRTDFPIVLGAEGPKNVALAAEIADGWITLFFGPRLNDFYKEALREGFSRKGARRSASDFEVFGTVPVVVNESVDKAADALRPFLALYIGGMGAAKVNFHRNMFVRLGYEETCNKITDLYLGGDKKGAAALVTNEMISEVALIGPKAKIRDELPAWKETVLTELVVTSIGSAADVRNMAELLRG